MSAWQDSDGFIDKRREVIAALIVTLRGKGVTLDVAKQAQLAEAKLFESAASLQEYEDQSTLAARLDLLDRLDSDPKDGSSDSRDPTNQEREVTSMAEAWLSDTPALWMLLVLGISIINVIASIATPDQLIQDVGGVPNASSRVWIRASSSGHALLAYICLVGMNSPRVSPLRSLTLRGIVIHTIVYGGGLMLGQYADGQTQGMMSNGTLIAFAVMAWFYFEQPPTLSHSKSVRVKEE